MLRNIPTKWTIAEVHVNTITFCLPQSFTLINYKSITLFKTIINGLCCAMSISSTRHFATFGWKTRTKSLDWMNIHECITFGYFERQERHYSCYPWLPKCMAHFYLSCFLFTWINDNISEIRRRVLVSFWQNFRSDFHCISRHFIYVLAKGYTKNICSIAKVMKCFRSLCCWQMEAHETKRDNKMMVKNNSGVTF